MKSKKTESERIFQVEQKMKQARRDDQTRRDKRNRKTSFMLTDKVECRIERVGENTWGSQITLLTDDGECVISMYGKTKNSADTLARTFLDLIGVRYRITRSNSQT